MFQFVTLISCFTLKLPSCVPVLCSVNQRLFVLCFSHLSLFSVSPRVPKWYVSVFPFCSSCFYWLYFLFFLLFVFLELTPLGFPFFSLLHVKARRQFPPKNIQLLRFKMCQLYSLFTTRLQFYELLNSTFSKVPMNSFLHLKE